MTDQTPQGTPEPGAQPDVPLEANSSRRPRPWLVPAGLGFAAGVVACLLVGGIVIGVSAGVKASNAAAAAKAEQNSLGKEFSYALDGCSIPENDDAQVADGGYTLTINGQGEEDATGISMDDWNCLETALLTPQSVISDIGQTSSLDGRQTATWSKLTMQWTYHPDRGLDAVYTLKH